MVKPEYLIRFIDPMAVVGALRTLMFIPGCPIGAA